MEGTAMALADDALWSLTVIAVVVGPPALLAAVVFWVARRLARLRTSRFPRVTPRPAARAVRG